MGRVVHHKTLEGQAHQQADDDKANVITRPDPVDKVDVEQERLAEQKKLTERQ